MLENKPKVVKQEEEDSEKKLLMSKQKEQGDVGETKTTVPVFSKIIPISNEGGEPLWYEGKNSFLQEHFNYEVSMFRFAGDKKDTLIQQRKKFRQEKNRFKEEECNIRKNMALEVFVIHWRALVEFFYKEENHKDDKRAYMFFSDKTRWGKTCPPKSKFVKEQETRSNKEVAHITSSRKWEGDPEKKWPYEEMKTELEKIIELFIQAI